MFNPDCISRTGKSCFLNKAEISVATAETLPIKYLKRRTEKLLLYFFRYCDTSLALELEKVAEDLMVSRRTTSTLLENRFLPESSSKKRQLNLPSKVYVL